jgi:Dyp-type peroxidase family
MSTDAIAAVATRVATRARTLIRPSLDPADIQGNVLRPYDNDHAGYLFVAIDDPECGRRLVRELLPHVTSGAEWVVPPPVTTNVACTFGGMRALGVPDDALRSFPVAFRQGMAGRAAHLGDHGDQGPDHWDPGLRDDVVHLVILLTAWRCGRLDERADELAERIDLDAGLRLVHRQRAERFDDRREHFGFLDGVAQPGLAGIDGPGTPPRGTPGPRGWRPLPVGEFVLGHPDAEGIAAVPPEASWVGNGSFVVVRKLYQDVAAFRSLIRETGRDYPGGPDLLAAKLVGRWPDGTPLSLSPDRPEPALAADPARINDFRFADDLDGARCPVGAHIRRANPRDGAGVGGAMTTRHRLLRRGVPYGPRLADGTDDGVDRGLMFVCYVADIERQFEFVLRRWVNDGDVLGVGHDPDPLIGTPSPGSKLKVPGDPPYFLALDRPLVRLKGGAYLFQPSVSALRRLADASW